MVKTTHRESRNPFPDEDPEEGVNYQGEKTLRSLAEAPIETGRELDTGLRRRPLEDFFLKGPIPFTELVPIARMPGKTLALWLLIIHRVTLSRKIWVTLPPYALKEWGISKDAKIDALRRLEQAGRVSVSRPPGGYLKVRLLWRAKTKAGKAA
jgi:hypothetical protein